MRVVVAGAGLGGLSLAAGLARGGHRVIVLEAAASLNSRPQGYRIHLDRRGLDALRTVLPEPAADLVEATCGRFAEPRRLEVMNGRLRHLKTIATGPSQIDGRLVSTAADRGTLHAVLVAVATDLGVEIRWDTAVSGYDEAGCRAVTVHAAGTATDEPLTADLLVGCDGARSHLAAQRLPQLTIDDDGAGSIVGCTELSAVSPRLIESLDHGYVVLRGLRTGVGLGLMRFANRPDQAGARAGLPLAAVEDYVMWNVGLTDRAELDGAGPDLLHRKAVHRLRGWHRDIRALVAAGVSQRTLLAPALRARRPAPWAPSRVTLLGDAVHVMPPDRGSGANLALADAARLAAALQGTTSDDEAGLLRAVGASERTMVEQAFAVTEAGPATARR